MGEYQESSHKKLEASLTDQKKIETYEFHKSRAHIDSNERKMVKRNLFGEYRSKGKGVDNMGLKRSLKEKKMELNFRRNDRPRTQNIDNNLNSSDYDEDVECRVKVSSWISSQKFGVDHLDSLPKISGQKSPNVQLNDSESGPLEETVSSDLHQVERFSWPESFQVESSTRPLSYKVESSTGAMSYQVDRSTWPDTYKVESSIWPKSYQVDSSAWPESYEDESSSWLESSPIRTKKDVMGREDDILQIGGMQDIFCQGEDDIMKVGGGEDIFSQGEEDDSWMEETGWNQEFLEEKAEMEKFVEPPTTSWDSPHQPRFMKPRVMW